MVIMSGSARNPKFDVLTASSQRQLNKRGLGGKCQARSRKLAWHGTVRMGQYASCSVAPLLPHPDYLPSSAQSSFSVNSRREGLLSKMRSTKY